MTIILMILSVNAQVFIFFNSLGYFGYSNLLHPDVFCSARYLEAQLIRIGADLFNGGQDCVGISTTGGTESILLAMVSYRNRAYSLGIEEPEV